MKTCSCCKEEKHLSDFHKDCTAKDGHKYQCKICSLAKQNKTRKRKYSKYCDKCGAEFSFRKVKFCPVCETKKCACCNKIKSLKSFYWDVGIANGFASYCISCDKEKKKEQHLKDKSGWRRRNLRSNYNITLEEYDILFEKQNGVCAICGKKEMRRNKYNTWHLAVDHSHESGKVRGLLCGNCNSMLGFVKDKPDLLLKAYSYLSQSEIGRIK